MNTLVIVLIAAVALVAAYALYGRWLAKKWGIDPKAQTPAVKYNDGKDYVPTNGWTVFSHQFSSIAGAGPVTGAIQAAYGCSLGGSFVGLLAARQNIHMDYGILGSSDLDQASPLAARLQTDFLLPLIYPVVRDGKFKAKFLQKRLDKRARESGDYVKAFLKMFGDARPYVTMQSCKNQFYSDLITPLPDKIHVPGTEIHIFYALKMGKKYRARYQQHFVHPVLHEQNLQHEELLACHPEQWAHLVKSIAL